MKRRNVLSAIIAVVFAPLGGFGLARPPKGAKTITKRRWLCNVVYKGERCPTRVRATKYELDQLLECLSRLMGSNDRNNVRFSLLVKAADETEIHCFVDPPGSLMWENNSCA